MAQPDTATDIRTSESLYHGCSPGMASPVAIAGWGEDLERRYECQVCFEIVRRGELNSEVK